MPPKKPAKNAYFLYMIDFKRDEEARGIVFRNGMHDVQKAASESWRKMSDSQKAVYKEREKREKLKDKTRPVERLTSQGVLLSKLQKNQREIQQGKTQMLKKIDKIISDCYINNTLPQQKFYFIAVNYFVEMQNKFIVPAEIALCEFSLKDGVSNKYHSFINPGELPIGKAYPAQQHTESTHKLPIPPNALGERDLSKICYDIADFILSDDKSEVCPVFCRESQTEYVKSVLQQFAMEVGEETLFEVYSLEYLFFVLKKATTDYAECSSEKDPFKNVYMAQMALDRDPFEYKTKIACEAHEEMDNGKFCSLSIVTRWAYQIADYCCLDMAISMIPAEHGPWDMDTQLMPMPIPSKDMTDKYEDEDDEYDSKSNISFAAKSSISLQTNITQPNIELVKVKKEDYDEEFPSLGTIPHTIPAEVNPWRKLGHVSNSASYAVNASGSSIESQDRKTKDEVKNPWATRNESKPRPPTEDSFSFSSIVSGRGRGIKPETETSSLSSRSYGRGNYIKRPKYE